MTLSTAIPTGAGRDGAPGATGATGADGGNVYRFFAGYFEPPNNSDWPDNNPAPAIADNLKNAQTVWEFVQSDYRAVGASIYIPTGMVNMRIRRQGRAKSAPAGARTVGFKLKERGEPSTTDSWSSGIQLADIPIATDTNWIYVDETKSLATWGLTAGQSHQLELVQSAPGAGTELTEDFYLRFFAIELS